MMNTRPFTQFIIFVVGFVVSMLPLQSVRGDTVNGGGAAFPMSRDRAILETYLMWMFDSIQWMKNEESESNRQNLANSIVRNAFKVWVFYKGPWAIGPEVPEYQDEVDAILEKNILFIARQAAVEASNTSDPPGVYDEKFNEDSYAPIMPKSTILGFNTEEIKTNDRYLEVMSQFQGWLLGQ